MQDQWGGGRELDEITYTGGYNLSVSGACNQLLILVLKECAIPLMNALRYFISRMSSYVGLAVGPTLFRISSRRRWVTSGCSASMYIANVRVEDVYDGGMSVLYKRTSRNAGTYSVPSSDE